MIICFLGIIPLSKQTILILQIVYTFVIEQVNFFAKLLSFNFVLADVLFIFAMQAALPHEY